MVYWLGSSGTEGKTPAIGGTPINQSVEVHQDADFQEDGNLIEINDSAADSQANPVVNRAEVTTQAQPTLATAVTQQQPILMPQYQMPVPPHLMPLRKFSGKGSVV